MDDRALILEKSGEAPSDTFERGPSLTEGQVLLQSKRTMGQDILTHGRGVPFLCGKLS